VPLTELGQQNDRIAAHAPEPFARPFEHDVGAVGEEVSPIEVAGPLDEHQGSVGIAVAQGRGR